MKKTIYIAAILALTACSNDELVESTAKDQSRINVRVVTSNPSRADVSSDTDFRHDSNTEELTFSLYAGYSSSTGAPQKVDGTYTYLDGDLMNYDNGTCSFDYDDDHHYYPMSKDSDSNYQYLSFFGYHDYNYNGEMMYGGLGAVKLDEGQYILIEDEDDYDEYSQVALNIGELDLPQDAKEQDDILYAVGQYPMNYDSTGDVQLNFRHALTQLAVQFENVSSAQNIYAEVHSVSFVNVARSGSLVIFDSQSDNIYPALGSQYKDKPDDGNRNKYNAYINCMWSPIFDEDDKSLNAVTYTFGEEDEDDPENQYEGLVPGNSYFTGVRETGIIANNWSTKHDVNLLVVPMTKEDMNGVKIKLRCNLYNLADYNDFVNASKDMSPAEAHELLVNGARDDNDNIIHAAYGVPIYAHEYVNLYDIPDEDYNNDPSSFYFNDLYFDVPEIEGGWKAGKKYIYTIKLGTGANVATDENGDSFLVPISIDVKVDDWALDKKDNNTTEDNVNI